MAVTTTAVSGQPRRNNGGTVFNAGNFSVGNITNGITLVENAFHKGYGTHVILADGSVGQSGNIGTQKVNSGGVFGKMEAGEYLIRTYSDRLAQQNSTVLASAGSDTTSRRSLHYSRGYRRYNITAWSYITGAATKGASAGALVGFVDPVGGGAISFEAYPTDAVPGELVYMVTGVTPTQDDYKPRTG